MSTPTHKQTQLPSLKSNSLSKLTSSPKHKILALSKMPSQPTLLSDQFKASAFQPIKKSTLQLNINSSKEAKADGPKPIKFVKNYDSVDLWKSKYGFYYSKTFEPRTQQNKIIKQIQTHSKFNKNTKIPEKQSIQEIQVQRAQYSEQKHKEKYTLSKQKALPPFRRTKAHMNSILEYKIKESIIPTSWEIKKSLREEHGFLQGL